MALGSHELLLLVRAQNQASALLSRVARDVRRMQQQRDLELRRAAVANRLARNSLSQMREQARISSVMDDHGASRIAHEQSIARNALQQQSIQDRIANLEVRRTGIQRALSNLGTQQLRIDQQKLRIEQSIEKLEVRRMGLQGQIGRLNTQLSRNQQQMSDLNRRDFGLETQRMERQLRYQQAIRRLAAAQRSGAGPKQIGDLTTQTEIARRRVQETVMSQRGIPGQRAILGSQANDIQASIATTQASMRGLHAEQEALSKSTEILQSREAALTHQLDNVLARSKAVTAAEKQLRAELTVVQGQLGQINARWEQHNVAARQAAANLAILREEEKSLNVQLAEQNALIAQQSSERIATTARAIGHSGRVIQIGGLLGAAGLSALAISAAHFNQETMRTATQTGAIGSGTDVIVRNSERASKAIIDVMRAVPANQNELNDALYNIYSSMNTTFGQGTKLLKLFAQEWEAGGMLGDVNGVSDAMITLGNNWQINAGDMNAWKHVAASTLATVRFGRLTVEQYTQTMNQLAPAFHGAHQSIDQMNGAIAFMTRLMPSQRMSAAGLARFMEILGRFAAKPASGFEGLAKSIQDTSGNLKPLDQIMDIFIKRFPQLKTSGVFLNNFIKLISNQQGTVQARRALMGLVQQNDLYKQTLANTTGDQKEFNRSLKAMEKSTGVRWQQFINDMKALALEIGTAATPALLTFGNYIQRAANYISGLSDHTKKTIAQIAVFISVGALLGGTLVAILGMFTVMIVSLRILSSTRGFAGLSKMLGSGGAAGAARVMSSEAGFMNLKLVGVLGSIALLIPFLIKFHDHLGGIHTVLTVLGSLLTAFTMVKLISSIGKMTGMLSDADIKAGNLKGSLLGLNGMVIGITIAETIIHTDKYKSVQKRLKDDLGPLGFLVDNVNQALMIGPNQLKHLKQDFSGKTQYVDSATVANYFRLVTSGVMGVSDIEQLKKVLKSADYQALIHHAKVLHRSRAFGTSGSGTAGTPPVTGTITERLNDPKLIASIKNVAQLHAAFTKAPSPASWRAWNNALTNATKGLTKEQKAMFDDLLSEYEQVDKKMKKISDSQVLTMQRNIKHLEAVAKRTGALKDYIALQKAQAALEKVATSDQLSAVQALMSAEDDLAQKRKEAAQKAAELHKQNMTNARNALQQTAQSIQQMFDSTLQQNQQAFGDLFSGRFISKSNVVADRQQFGFGLRPQDIMKDLNMQVSDFSRFTGSLDKLRSRGAPQEMITQLQQMGPEAQKQISLLLKFTPQQFRKYVNAFQRGQKLIQQETEHEVNSQLKKWERFGRKVQLAIINGMQSENPELQNAIMIAVRKMFPGLTKQSHTKAPKAAHTEIHNYNINTDHSPRGVKTAITEARFQYKNRKRPLS